MNQTEQIEQTEDACHSSAGMSIVPADTAKCLAPSSAGDASHLGSEEPKDGEGATLGQEIRELVKLALPLGAVQGGNNLYGVSDTVIVGKLGAVPLGAVGLGHSVFFGFTISGYGVMMGFDPLISQALGAGDEIRARKLMWQSVWLAAIVGAVLTVPLVLIAPFLHVLQVDAQVARAGMPYLLARTAGIIPLMVLLGVRSYLQAKGRTSPLVWGMVIANVANVFATLWTAFGGAGLPAWTGPLRLMPAFGATGAAVSSTLCIFIQLAIVILAIRKMAVPGFTRDMRRPVASDLWKAFRIGLPIGLQMTAEVGLFAIVTVLAGQLGPLPLASHQIAITLAGLTFSFAQGIGMAGAVRVGRGVGALSLTSVRRAGFTAFAVGGAFMACCALAFFLWPTQLSRLVSSDPDVLRIAIPLLGVAAFYQLSDGFQAVGAGVLRGAGDVRLPFLFNVVGHYAVGLPVALVLGRFGSLGVEGLWWGIFAGLTFVATAMFIRFVLISRHPIQPLEAGSARG